MSNLHTLTVDLHGYSLANALAEVERELNHSFYQEEKSRAIKFITGFGAVLRPGLRHYLVNHPLVKEMSIDGISVWIELEKKR